MGICGRCCFPTHRKKKSPVLVKWALCELEDRKQTGYVEIWAMRENHPLHPIIRPVLSTGLLITLKAKVLVTQPCPTLCNLMDHGSPGSSVHGILQARTLEWVAISFSKRNYRKKESKVAQSCPTPCNPMDCSLPGYSIHGIFQARVLEWVAISFSNLNLSGM